MLVKSIVRQCEMAADMTVGKRDVTVLHLSCPQRECVTFKPTGSEERFVLSCPSSLVEVSNEYSSPGGCSH